MSDKLTLQELLEVQQFFKLPSTALVEKDWYVIKALAAIRSADHGPFRLVFGGGTALSRAHRLIQRMSEDIDLKIVAETKPSHPDLRMLRKNISEALLGAGFIFNPENRNHRDSNHKSQYTIYKLPCDPIAPMQGNLRTEIQIETAVWPVRRALVALPLSSFVAEGFKRKPELAEIECTGILESAGEKLVALTRRYATDRARGKRDPKLVRHVHDIHVIREKYDQSEVADLAREIMPADAEIYGKRFPAYRDNPLDVTLGAIESIAADKEFAKDYATFQRDMVYGDRPKFEDAIATLNALGELLKKGK